MLDNTLKDIDVFDPETLTGSEESTDFTLAEHYTERINFHSKMLNYYLREECGIGS